MIQKINIVTSASGEEVLRYFTNELTNKVGILSMLRKSKTDKDSFKARINPPRGAADPFKSIVHGSIESRQGKTLLRLTFLPGIGLVFGTSIWYYFLGNYIAQEFAERSFIETCSRVSWGVLTPLLIAYIKYRWDVSRLKAHLKFWES